MQIINFDESNKVKMTSKNVSKFIHKEKKVTVIFEAGFKKGSDTEDVFRGLMGDEAFENCDEMMDAIYFESEIKQTFFLSNAEKETPFNEIGMVKRLIADDFWTSLILHDHELKDGLYAMVKKI